MSNRDWNAALEAAAALLGEGFMFVRRPVGLDMKQQIEVTAGNSEVEGEYDEATHVSGEEFSVAAVLSLRKSANKTRGGAAGGRARAASMTPEARKAVAQRAANARWHPQT